ncbi:hypothetical protein HYV69_03665 [Candidatus Uhrbacteria bacterium]|nr:hypothetical protein [Candidatus Uhrbacteria bacterium]
MACFPALGEVFELTLDGSAPDNDPIEMVHRSGEVGFEKWRHRGKLVKGVQTRRFKLITIGCCDHFSTVVAILKEHGKIPEGQWREVLITKFQSADGGGTVGIADDSWRDQYSYFLFPCIRADSGQTCVPFFDLSEGGFNNNWRWLVEVDE